MQNFNYNMQPTSILAELSGGNAELGAAFASVLDNMVRRDGITNLRAEPFDIVPRSWKILADKKDKTPEDIAKLDEVLFSEIHTLAQSYLLYMARETKNLTGKITYPQYEDYMLKHKYANRPELNNKEFLTNIKKTLYIAFKKIASHGIENDFDNLIDKMDMASFLYALITKSQYDEHDKFIGFVVNGVIVPREYAVSEHLLFEEGENLFSVKMRIGYKVLNNIIK